MNRGHQQELGAEAVAEKALQQLARALTDKKAQRILARSVVDRHRSQDRAEQARLDSAHRLSLRSQALEVADRERELADHQATQQSHNDELAVERRRVARRRRAILAFKITALLLVISVVAAGVYAAWTSQLHWLLGLGIPATAARMTATVLEASGVALGMLARWVRWNGGTGTVPRIGMRLIVMFAVAVNFTHNTAVGGPLVGVVYGFVSAIGPALWEVVETVLFSEQHGGSLPTFGVRWLFFPWRTLSALRTAVFDGLSDSGEAWRKSTANRPFRWWRRRAFAAKVTRIVTANQAAELALAEQKVAHAEQRERAIDQIISTFGVLFGSDFLQCSTTRLGRQSHRAKRAEESPAHEPSQPPSDRVTGKQAEPQHRDETANSVNQATEPIPRIAASEDQETEPRMSPQERRAWDHWLAARAAGSYPSGADLDRAATANNKGRAWLRRWLAIGLITELEHERAKTRKRRVDPPIQVSVGSARSA